MWPEDWQRVATCVGGWTYDGLDGLWSNWCLLLKFRDKDLSICIASDLAGVPGFWMLARTNTSGRVAVFCLVFRALVWSLEFQMLV